MLKITKVIHDINRMLPENNNKNHKTYCKPHLKQLGDLRTVTLGPTGANVESGNTFFPS